MHGLHYRYMYNIILDNFVRPLTIIYHKACTQYINCLETPLFGAETQNMTR